MAFTFGGGAAGTGGFSFGATPATSATTGFSFGAPATSTAGSGFGFASAPAVSNASTGFSFGAPAAPSTGLSFGTPASSASTGFSFGAAAPTSTAFSLNAPASTATSFSFGAPTATTTSTGLSFGTPATSTVTATPFSFPTAASSGATTGFSFGAPTTASTGFSFVAPSAATTASTGFPFATSSTLTAPSTGFSFGSQSSAANTAPTFSLGTVSTAGGTATGLTQPQQLSDVTYGTLEKHVNQWREELEQQEAAFLRQATQINAWDRLLISNREKIASINEIVAHAKEDQKRLNTELDFVVSQQNELEALLKPLEREVENMPQLPLQHHTDAERQNTYHLMENVNAQLHSMSEGVKEIIEDLNASNASLVADTPIGQISKILNAHMDALQYIETTLGGLQQKTENLNRSFFSYRT